MTKENNIRQAKIDDVNHIYEIIRENPEEVLPRPYQNILAHFDRFYVYDDGEVSGVVSWQMMPVIDLEEPDFCVEIISLSVSGNYMGKGIGRALVERMITEIRRINPHRIIVLTYYPDFFEKFGFIETSKKELYQKIYQGCLNCTKHKSPLTCPEVAMELRL
jgi:N-acetylglutamate synthase-like GNAT family acetyltransferase